MAYKDEPLKLGRVITLKITHLKCYGNRISLTYSSRPLIHQFPLNFCSVIICENKIRPSPPLWSRNIWRVPKKVWFVFKIILQKVKHNNSSNNFKFDVVVQADEVVRPSKSRWKPLDPPIKKSNGFLILPGKEEIVQMRVPCATCPSPCRSLDFQNWQQSNKLHFNTVMKFLKE